MHRKNVGHLAAALTLTVSAAFFVPAATAALASDASRPRTETGHHHMAAQSDLPPRNTWIQDVTAVTDHASAYLETRLPDRSIKPAIVLDIDNTALETTYTGGITIPATPPVLALAQQAHAAGAAVIFVTARSEIIRPYTEANLDEVGHPNDGLYLRGVLDSSSNQTLKTNARIAIEKAGYTIVASIGNNDSDLGGGHAERTFKLPDYDGRLN